MFIGLHAHSRAVVPAPYGSFAGGGGVFSHLFGRSDIRGLKIIGTAREPADRGVLLGGDAAGLATLS